MKARMLTMALLVAAMMSVTFSASAQGRKGEFAKNRKMDIRKEIRFRQCQCPRCMELRKMQMVKFDPRFKDPRFRDARFDKGFVQHKHGKKFHRR